MKIFKLLPLLLFFFTFSTFGQKLTISELQKIHKLNTDKLIEFMTVKGWDYSGNSGDDGSNIDFAFAAESNLATSWLTIYASNKDTRNVAYQIHVKSIYLKIKKELPTLGYKFIRTETDNNKLISIYKSKDYLLQITTKSSDDGTSQYQFYLWANK